MADIVTHLRQADHNRDVARHLLAPPRHDWAITAAFYAAVHCFEAWLFDEPEKHTETSIPTIAGELRFTPHAWREKLIQLKGPQEVFKSFRQLRNASETARYLSLFRFGTAHDPEWIGAPAPTHFSLATARSLVETDLESVRAGLGIPLRRLLADLDLTRRDPVNGSSVRSILLGLFSTPEELLRQSEPGLRRVLGPGCDLLLAARREHGMTLQG